MEKEELLKNFIPEELREFFDIQELEEKEKEWKLILEEKAGQIPKDLEGKDGVLNGYLKPVEIIDFPFRGKLMYITFHRRRWKAKEFLKKWFISVGGTDISELQNTITS